MNLIKRYVNTVERNLRLDRATRLRIMRDLGSDIQARQERGETPEAILAELGPAEAVAESFNREFRDHAVPRKSRWRWLFLAGAVLAGGGAAFLGLTGFSLWKLDPAASAIGVIGGSDGPTTIFVTSSVPALRWSWHELIPLALGCAAAFLLLQWPAAPRPDAGQPPARAEGPRLWLPALLAGLGLGLWVLFSLLAAADGAASLTAGQLAARELKRFFLHGGFLPAAALFFALRRLAGARHGLS